MQRRSWSYQKGYKPRWIIYCTTAIAPMIVEGAEVKQASARAPQDHVAVIISNDQWSHSQQGEEEKEEDDRSEFMPSCQVFSAKSKAYEELDKWQSWWETYEADEIVDLCPNPKTMRMFPSKQTNPKEEEAPRRPTSPATSPPRRRQGTCRSCSTGRSTSSSCTRRRGTSPSSSSSTRRRRTSRTTRRRGTCGHATRRRRSSPERRRGTRRSNRRRRPKPTRRRGCSPSCHWGRRPQTRMGEGVGGRSGGPNH